MEESLVELDLVLPAVDALVFGLMHINASSTHQTTPSIINLRPPIYCRYARHTISFRERFECSRRSQHSSDPRRT
jgi:hypothetical protein